MVGILVFTVPTPNFGPPILAMAFWAAVLLFYWQAAIEGRRRSWYPLGGAAALLLLTSDAALILLGTLAVFTALSASGRAALRPIEAWIVLAGLAVVLFVHLFWLKGASDPLAPTLARLRIAEMAGENTAAWLRLLGALVLAHAGLAILVVLASGWPRTHADPAPAIARAPVVASAITFVKVFAFIPALLATAVTVLLGQRLPIGGAAPLLVLSGLAVVVAAGEAIALHHQRTLGFAWAGLLVGAGDPRSRCDCSLAVDYGHRSRDRPAGGRHGPLLCRQLRAPHRAPARHRQRRYPHRRAGGARRAEPP